MKTVNISENLPELTYLVGKRANISTEIVDFIKQAILQAETEEWGRIKNYSENRAAFEINLEYSDVTIQFIGTLYETREHWDSNDYDQPSEDNLTAQWIEIDEFKIYTENGDYIEHNFNQMEFNAEQFKNRKQ